jgi:hypothetical protein
MLREGKEAVKVSRILVLMQFALPFHSHRRFSAVTWRHLQLETV